jgi:hypothetical protein
MAWLCENSNEGLFVFVTFCLGPGDQIGNLSLLIQRLWPSGRNCF